MSNKTFNIYCDESTHLEHDGHPFMIYGYVCIASNQIKMAKEQLKAIKDKYGFKGELKWTNVHDKTSKMYNDIVEYFFMTDIQFRAVIVDKSVTDSEIIAFSVDERSQQKRKNIVRTYIYNKTRKYVIMLEPQLRHKHRAYYLLSAYYLNKDYGEKQMRKKMKSKMDAVL